MSTKTLPPHQLSRELREGTDPDLSRRRLAIGISFLGVAIGAVVGAYQTGLIRRLPDILPGKFWDAEKVDESDYAYSRLQTPDAALMIVNYGVTAALVSAGGQDRARDNPALPLAAAAKAVYDFVTCVRLAKRSGETIRRCAAGASSLPSSLRRRSP